MTQPEDVIIDKLIERKGHHCVSGVSDDVEEETCTYTEKEREKVM